MSTTNTLKRITRLEDASMDDEPFVKMNFIYVEIPGEAVMDGVRYPSEAEAVAAVPPGEDHIIVQVVDGRRKPSTKTEELQS